MRFHRQTLVRILKVLAFLLERNRSHPATAAEIMAAAGEIDDKTVVLNDTQKRAFERLKENLRELGVPLKNRLFESTQFDPERKMAVSRTTVGYWVPEAEYVFRSVDLTGEECTTLGLLASLLAQEEGFPIRADFAQALQKIVNAQEHPPPIDVSERTMAASPEAVSPQQDPEILDKLINATCERQPVEFQYRSFHSNQTRRRSVEPFGLFGRRGIWYVVGRDIELNEVRVFRVSRIQSTPAVRRKATFEIPEGFNIRDYAGVAPWNFASSGPERDVTVEFDPDEFWRVRDYCSRHGTIENRSDGATLWKVKVRDYDPLIKWLLPLGTAVIPRDPQDFVERYHELVSDTLRRYGG